LGIHNLSLSINCFLLSVLCFLFIVLCSLFFVPCFLFFVSGMEHPVCSWRRLSIVNCQIRNCIDGGILGNRGFVFLGAYLV